MRKIVPKTSFLGGEAGFLLEGRSDLAQHQLGVRAAENFIILKGGGATRRPGTRYVKTTQATKPARLIPFVVSYDSGTDIYVVEITLASSTTIEFRVIRVSDNAVYTPTGSTVTVASTVNIQEIQFCQSADFLFLVHDAFAPLMLYRSASTPTFVVTTYINYSTSSRALAYSLPYRDPNADTTIDMSVNTATVGTGRTLTATAAVFNSGHVGTYFQLDVDNDGDYEGSALVTAYISSTQVTVQVVDAFAGTTNTTKWREGAWSTYRGFPRTVTLYNQRLVFGGNDSQPDTFWCSQTGDYFQMSIDPTSTAVSDPLNFTLASNKLNQIRWMVGGKKLTIGTSSSEWVGTITEEGTTLSVQFNQETTHGSAYVQPSPSAYTTPFIQRGRKTVREMAFNFDNDAYQATDLNLFASHIGSPYGRFANSTVRIIGMAYQESPFNVLWVWDNCGRLYGLTRDKQQQIAAWHSHVIGGALTETILTGLSGDDYPAFVTSACVVPDSSGEVDRLWLVVRRAINGTDTYHVEYIDDIKAQPYLMPGTSASDVRIHLDCATLQTGASATTWTGYTRFASTNAYVVAANALGVIVQAGAIAVNSSGEITLTNAATVVALGLNVDAELRLLPFEGGDEPKLYMRSQKRSDEAALRLHETWGLRTGKDRTLRKTGWEENTTFEPIPFDSSEPPLIYTFTGIKNIKPATGVDQDGSFALAMQEPWPCTILSICSRVVSNEV